jgi:hypothetical protein
VVLGKPIIRGTRQYALAVVRERARAPHDANSSSNAFASFRSSVSAFGEPAVDRSAQFASLLRLALVTPEARHAHCRAQFPGMGRNRIGGFGAQ